MRECSKCNAVKADEDFYVGKRVCKACRHELRRVYRSLHKNEIAQKNKEYWMRADVRQRRKEYVAQHQNQLNASKQKYCALHPDRVRATKKKYEMAHRQEKLIKQKAYREANKNKLRIIFREYARKKSAIDINFRLARNLRCRLRYALRAGNTYKSLKTMELLGCSIVDLKTYLEQRFKCNMTWDNYGNKINQWSVDHIRPCASFDLSDLAQQKQCFHYTNLQPLWHIDNIKKGAKYERS